MDQISILCMYILFKYVHNRKFGKRFAAIGLSSAMDMVGSIGQLRLVPME